MVLRMAFTDKLTYVRNVGFRTAAIALPFSLLREFANDNSEMVPAAGLEPALNILISSSPSSNPPILLCSGGF